MGTSSLPEYDPRRVAILIPAYNEEKYIEKTLKALLNADIGKVYVADDASIDKTVQIAERLGVKVLESESNLGKGGVLSFALPQISADIILLLDADLGESSPEGKKLVQSVLQGADLAIAQFRSKGGFGLVRRISSFLLYLKTGKYFNAPLSGQRAAKKEVWDKLLPFAPGFSIEVAMLKTACMLKLEIVEVPVDMVDRSYGKGLKGIKHRFRQLIAVVKGLRS